jgi:hypothetical protein
VRIVPAPPLGGAVPFELVGPDGTDRKTLALEPGAPRLVLDCLPGEYTLALVPPGPAGLTALPARFTLEAGETHELDVDLLPALVARGSVTDAAGLGLADVPLALQSSRADVAETRTRFDGRFAFEPLPGGDYELVVGDPLAPLCPRRPLRLESSSAELALVLPPLLELEVRVLDERGLPVADARVEGKGKNGGRVAGATDGAGLHRATQLVAGSYWLFASHPDFGRGNRAFELDAGTESPLEIRLLRAGPER